MIAPPSASMPMSGDAIGTAEVSASANEVASLVDLANSIAGLEKIRELKAKGRPVTSRAISQWLRSSQYKKVIATKLLYALERAEQITSSKEGEAFYRFVRLFLMEQIPTRGRPTKRGIISSAMRPEEKRRPGRPAAMTLQQEKEWASNILKVKFEMLGDAHKIKSYEELCRRHFNDPLFETDVSDARAIEEAQRRFHVEHGTVFDRSVLPALKARYSREKRPPPKPKTGG
jgi:hypothetical protein